MQTGGRVMRKWVVVLLVFMAGCAVWQQTGGPFSGAGYTLDLPKGWMASKNTKNMGITRDGLALQQIRVRIADITKQDDEDAKKILKKGMLPQEAAERVLDIMRSDKSLSQFTLVENAPAQIGGREGFRLVYTYRNDPVRYRTVYYGLLQGETFYRISYTAPVRYYFDKDVAVFEAIVKSFKLTGTSASAL
jgi:hypothetical protein